MGLIREVGFPIIAGDFDIFHFCLPSQGSHSSENFLLKSVNYSSRNEGENTKLLYLCLAGKNTVIAELASER